MPARLQLWREKDVRDLLHAPAMGLRGLLDRAALEKFLLLSPKSAFPFDSQWTRLLSLEYTLRALESTGTKATA